MNSIVYGPSYSLYGAESLASGLGVGALIAIIVAVYGSIFVVGILNYILSSIGLYKIAKRRGLSNPWLAWIPVTSFWIIGGIAGEYDDKRGIGRSWKKALLASMLVVIVSLVLMIVMAVVMVAFAASASGGAAIAVLVLMIALYAAVIVAALAYSVCMFISLFKIYESTYTEKALKYMIISLIVPLGQGICLFCCRNKGYSNNVTQINAGYSQTNYMPPQA